MYWRGGGGIRENVGARKNHRADVAHGGGIVVIGGRGPSTENFYYLETARDSQGGSVERSASNKRNLQDPIIREGGKRNERVIIDRKGGEIPLIKGGKQAQRLICPVRTERKKGLDKQKKGEGRIRL